MKIDIVGGTYREFCFVPIWNEVYGSALRAAIAVSEHTDVVLHTYLDEEILPLAQAHTILANVELRYEKLDQSHSFSYLYPLSDPSLDPPKPLSRSSSLVVEGTNILRFGMIEASPVVNGDFVVYDPQSEEDPEPFTKNGSTAKNLAIVANKSEVLKLGDTVDYDIAVKKLLTECKVLVVKNGPYGATVYSNGATTPIEPYSGEKIWKIGSGDVFSAMFSLFWSVQRKTAEESASLASIATALYCETQYLPISVGFNQNDDLMNGITKISNISRKRVYLAAPFFDLAQSWMVNEVRFLLEREGHHVFSPVHNVGFGHHSSVVEPDLQAIKDCDIVFAIANGADVGTIFEIGYARALDKPAIVLIERGDPEDFTMILGSKCTVVRDITTAIYKVAWD